MKVKDFHYELPPELIAQKPLLKRDASRMLVLNKKSGVVVDDLFQSFPKYLHKGDVMVLNDTSVIPARLHGIKQDTGAVIEVLLLRALGNDCWECLVKHAKKVKKNTVIAFGNHRLIGKCIKVLDEGIRHFEMTYEGDFDQVLDRLGETPLPPYIHEVLDDSTRYQTVYSKHKGSVAAPTAGLHFTEQILKEIKAYGVEIVYITLHVGLGTFRPVKVEQVEKHTMHEEYYTVSSHAAETINKGIRAQKRVIGVGTTSMRTLETVANAQGFISAGSGMSNLFIFPGYQFKVVNALLTNFHLPESTLLMLVSAFADREMIMRSYRHAIENNYRFFSFGDAMFLTDTL